ncbi:hypothetical protein [Algoriphagus boritolerans]|uniref:hypothetical protein n=1 Tax=Algoriphagus boritolerans TaxID=308111 RepID=UPI000B3155B0
MHIPFSTRNPDGTFTNTAPVGNPVAQFEYNSNNQTNDYRSVGNFFMDVKFLKDFTFRSNFGLDLSFRDGKNFTPVFFCISYAAKPGKFHFSQYGQSEKYPLGKYGQLQQRMG